MLKRWMSIGLMILMLLSMAASCKPANKSEVSASAGAFVEGESGGSSQIIIQEQDDSDKDNENKIKQSLVSRTRKTGDYFTIAGSHGKMVRKSLKDYMIDRKIPKGDRDKLLLLAEGSHVVWLVGHRISEYYKITADTKRILQVQYVPKTQLDREV